MADQLAEGWQSAVNWFYSSLTSRRFGWILIAALYIAFLIIFTHVDLIISLINNPEGTSFLELAIKKHANLVSLLTNIGLLMFLCIDLLIAFNKKISYGAASIINLIGITACVLVLVFSLGCVKPDMKEYGAIEWELGVILSWSVFFIALVVLKAKALTDNEIRE